jgi:hypothetical protein
VIVSLCAAKASPGVTSTAALLALHWPRPSSVLIEADPAGGALIARWAGALAVSYEPGLISLAATREPITAASLHVHSQLIGIGTRLLAAPPHAGQSRAALASLSERASASMGSPNAGMNVIVDCGRLDPMSPALAFARRSVVTLLLARPRLDEVALLASTAASLRDAGCVVELVCIGSGPYHPIEVAAHAQIPLAGVIADDPRAAATFGVHGPTARGLARSALARSVSELAAALSQRAPEPLVAMATDPSAVEVTA